ncbi:uncharacterized protein [Clytia hemisphaerica]|uniref:G-protein coupled receptors family 1 profile domain-containing protein n=1 Tax=Clytia hemisphaerica TaxID=252671 RepID=A0A7M6DS27_9CNID
MLSFIPHQNNFLASMSFLQHALSLPRLPFNMFNDPGLLHFSIIATIATIAIIANIYLVTYIMRTKTTPICKNSCYGYYLLHISFLDILASTLAILLSINTHAAVKPSSSSMSWISLNGHYLNHIFCGVVHSTIALMLYQKFLCLRKSSHKRKAFFNLKLSLSLTWCWAVGSVLPEIIVYKNAIEEEDRENSSCLIVIIVLLIIVPFLMIGYYRISILRLRTCESVLLLKRSREYRKFASVCLLLSIALVACNLPKYLYHLLQMMNKEGKIDFSFSEKLQTIFDTISWLYLPFIPLIYCLTYRIYKRKAKLPDLSNNNNNNNISALLESKFLSMAATPTPTSLTTSRSQSVPNFDPRRRSLFDRRKSNSSVEDILDICSRRFSARTWK